MIVPTVFLVLVLVAVALTLGSVFRKVPLWAAVFVLCLIELLRALPR